MKSGIYLIKNIINNKIYIGSSVNIVERWQKHKKDLRKGKHHSKHLQSAWDIYGEQTFKFKIIQEVSNPEHLLAYEQVYLDYYKSYEKEKGYNTCRLASSRYGIKVSEETKELLRNINVGKKLSEEIKRKISKANYGRKHTECAKKKISEAHSGKKYSEETRKKISEAKTGTKHTEEAKKKISEASKRRPEMIEALRKINIGRKHTQESKNKISESHRKNNNNKYYSFDKDKNKYRVRIWGKHIGHYNTEEEAKQAVVINLEKLKAQQIVSP